MPRYVKTIVQEMKDRESKRWLLEEFVKENEIRAVELEMAYKRFKNLAPASGSAGKQNTSSVEMDFNTWILVSCSIETCLTGGVLHVHNSAHRRFPCPGTERSVCTFVHMGDEGGERGGDGGGDGGIYQA